MTKFTYAESIIKDQYLEIQMGNASGDFSGLDFINPVGVGSTSNATSGNNIILNDVDKSDSASILTLSTGGLYNEDIAVSLSFQTLNSLNAKGYATFGGTAYDQVMKSSGNSIFLGGGYHIKSGQLFFEPKLELGIARIKSDAIQRIGGSISFALHSLNQGVQIFRVHDVLETKQAIAVWERLES